jgi:N6-L-threonylcarbamoyladenine synthase
MRVLGIETSCDETAAAVVEDARVVLSDVVGTQVDLHARYGGVVPEIASRRHLEVIDDVIALALDHAGIALRDVEGLAVTTRPGLIGSLVVGLSSAKAYAWAASKPIVGVHHIVAHLSAARLAESGGEPPPVEPPFVGLVASGGHSDLILVRDWLEPELVGETRDDAAGEALDKVARHLGLGYPGGPALEAAARGSTEPVEFPVADLGDSLDFSFSGVKTAVVRLTAALGPDDTLRRRADLAAGFQAAVVGPLARNAARACVAEGVDLLIAGGGVAANALLRSLLADECAAAGITLALAPMRYCTDNAAMVASAGCELLSRGRRDDLLLDCESTGPIARRRG